MKIKAIASLCKKQKRVHIYNIENRGTIRQFVGDGYACYPIDGMPKVDEKTILAIFDVPENQREKWMVFESQEPQGIDFRDVAEGEEMGDVETFTLGVDGATIKPMNMNGGILFFDAKYQGPIMDMMDMMEFYRRKAESGKEYIVAKAGFMLQAIIFPYRLARPEFIAKMRDFIDRCQQEVWKEDTRSWAKVDKETGEVEEAEG